VGVQSLSRNCSEKTVGFEPHVLAQQEDELRQPCRDAVVPDIAPASSSGSAGYAQSQATSVPKAKASRRGPRIFKSVAQDVVSIVRMQLMADDGVPLTGDEVGLVQRLAITLASPQTFDAIASRVFQTLSKNDEQGRPYLSKEQLPEVLEHWGIPQAHLHLFTALLRKQDMHWDTPDCPVEVHFCDFKETLIKFLRRVRDLHSGHQVSKEQFVPKDARQMKDVYIEGDPCGSGSFGDCFWVTNRATKRKSVCKRIATKTEIPSEEVPAELDVLKSLDHPHIVRVFEWFASDDGYIFVMEPARGGDVRRLLLEARARSSDPERCSGLEENLSSSLIRQALRGLSYIHSRKIIHRDIKPGNMLLTSPITELERAHLVLADFGIAEIFKERADTKAKASIKGTAMYMAIEVFERPPGPRADIWSLGVVTFEILCGNLPAVVRCDNVHAMYMKLRRADVCLEPLSIAGVNERAIDCVRQLLTRKEVDRPTAASALELPWLAEDATIFKLDGRVGRKMVVATDDYASMSVFSKIALNCVAAQLDASQLDGIDKAFNAIDVNHDGELSLEELTEGLKLLGVDPCSASQLADALDVNHDGVIQYSEFVASLLKSQNELAESNLRSAFDIFDVDHNGSISLDELRLMLSGGGALACILPDGSTPDAVLKEVDTSGDGTISFSEFRNYLMGETSAAAAQMRKRKTTDSIPVFSIESLDATLQHLSVLAGHSAEEGSAIASRLAEEHYITKMGDLIDMGEQDWPRLGLPLKLENLLRNCSIMASHAT